MAKISVFAVLIVLLVAITSTWASSPQPVEAERAVLQLTKDESYKWFPQVQMLLSEINQYGSKVTIERVLRSGDEPRFILFNGAGKKITVDVDGSVSDEVLLGGMFKSEMKEILHEHGIVPVH
mmetsp:Transcript_32469/g.84049  ORF Transcript_32469/g.84049 Transcript_32469/m.84049 type:complete len:123 (-) Transcript_32469:380-748(-)